MTNADSEPLLRIGELSRRVALSDHVLRAWESRYGLLRPVRSAGGFRLYSTADERRIRRMQTFLANGLSTAEAARAVLREDEGASAQFTWNPEREAAGSSVTVLQAALRQALDAYDEPAAEAVLDRLFADLSLATALREVVVPYLAELGNRWESGTASVAQEHFASNVLRGRLSGLARGWGVSRGPGALLACAPGDAHDLALMIFGIVLNRGGWRIHFLGADTPIEDLVGAADATRPDLVVVVATVPDGLEPARPTLAALARRHALALAGPGATRKLAKALGAELLSGDPVTEAERMPFPATGMGS